MSDRSLLSPSRYWKSYTTFASDVDLTTDGPGRSASDTGVKLTPREIHVVSGGVVALTRPDGTNDTTPALAPGTILPVEAKVLRSSGNGTTATAIMVFW